MSGKSSKQYLFEVQLNWLTGTRGVLSAMDAEGTVRVGTPPEFGGSGKPWSPEHLFLSSVSSCFMSTYIVFAKKISGNFFLLIQEQMNQNKPAIFVFHLVE